MAKSIITIAKTKDFQPTLDDLNRICIENPHFNRSEIMRMAIRFWVSLYRAKPKDRMELYKSTIQRMFYDNKVKSQNPT